MRRIFMVAAVAALAIPVATRADQTSRLDNAAEVLSEMRAAPDAGIPRELWEGASCVAVIPNVKKAAFVVGGEYGKGVLSCRHAAGWTAPAFVQLTKGSFGAQIGGEEIDFVLLFMNDKAVDKLLDTDVALGAGVSVAAGPVGRTAQAGTDIKMQAQILSYSRSRGVFAGIDLSGGKLGPDKSDNADAYGPKVTPRQVVRGTGVKPPAGAARFMAALAQQPGKPVATSGSSKPSDKR
jgi:lipid-binding SYLF domain-containing protein